MKKKVLSVALSLALMFGSLLLSSDLGKSFAEAEDDWNYCSGKLEDEFPMFPYVDFSPFEINLGTIDDPYIISTAEQLAALSVLSNNLETKRSESEVKQIELSERYDTGINKWYEYSYLSDKYENLRMGEDFYNSYILIDQDIDLSAHKWNPIGSTSPFRGNINFQGHTIEGIRIMAKGGEDVKFLGLFAESDGSISNLTIGRKGFVHCDAKGVYFGNVVAFNKGKVINCRNEFSAKTINGELLAIAGGIVGCNAPKGIIERCVNTGKVAVASCENEIVGGIVGNLSIASESKVNYCNNAGDVCIDEYTSLANDRREFRPHKKSCIGGVVGDQPLRCSKVTNCINSGKLDISTYVNEIYCGQIAGFGFEDCISNCYYLNRPSKKTLAAFNETNLLETIILQVGIGNSPRGEDLESSTKRVNRNQLDRIALRWRIPA